MADEEFGNIADGAGLNAAATGLIVLLIIWCALKSGRIVFAVALSVIIGLAATAAVGLMMVGALNLISVAFAVLFVGIGVDFGIQFSVRYRAERYKEPQFGQALVQAAGNAGRPLALAAAATAAGFYSFLPTDYRGVSELGLIAGTGQSPVCDHRRDIGCGLGRNAFAPPPAFRFQSAELTQLQSRIRCNLAGFDEGSEHRHQYDRRSRSFSH
jgi:hypothetical protein